MHSEHILKERSDAQNVVSRFPCGVQPFYTTLGTKGRRATFGSHVHIEYHNQDYHRPPLRHFVALFP